MSLFRSSAILAAAILTAGAVQAAEPSKPEIGHYVDVSPTALPILWHGRLVNYVFVKVRVMLAPNLNASDFRVKEPFHRDALVRIGYRTPFVVHGDLTKVDEPALRRAMLAEAIRILGPRTVTGITVPMQTPQRLSGLPKSP
jgi:hypothetical protein